MSYNSFHKKRYDFFLIWGHGMQYKKEIVDEIKKNPDFSIKLIKAHTPKSIKKLINEVYSFDYAPIRHLRKKTRYLKKTPTSVLFIFIENKDVEETLLGKKKHIHIECKKVKIFKEMIRSRFNPKNEEGKRSEHHVIHASDNHQQTVKMLHHLKINQDRTDPLGSPSQILTSAPHHLKAIKCFEIRTVRMSELRQVEIQNDGSKKLIPIKESRHYKLLSGHTSPYAEYYDQNRGNTLTDPHFQDDFLKLAENFNYLDQAHPVDYIITQKNEQNQYVIKDGSHRAAILVHKKTGSALVAVI
jgi:hypothetical protein